MLTFVIQGDSVFKEIIITLCLNFKFFSPKKSAYYHTVNIFKLPIQAKNNRSNFDKNQLNVSLYSLFTGYAGGKYLLCVEIRFPFIKVRHL